MKPLIFQTDFGNADGAVSAMYGVANGVSDELKIFDITHEIPQYDIWEASYRLIQTVGYWKEGSVFVSVVDPGVGSTRRSIVAKTKKGQYAITPDNGTLTHLKLKNDIVCARIIDESLHRLPGSSDSYTFHGRDIYAYTGAKLAAGVISFEDIGPEVEIESITELPTLRPVFENMAISGSIDVLDVRFGSLWSNIGREWIQKLGIEYGKYAEVKITNDGRTIYKNIMIFARSFAEVSIGETLVYINSLDNLAVAINQGSFSRAYNIGTGTNWQIEFRKAPKVIYE